MVSSNSKPFWKEVGWNGIRISVPEPWETDRLGDRYILLECDGFPIFEAKWDKIKGKFYPDKHVKQLKSLFQKQQTGQNINSWVIPPNWSKVLSAYNIAGFKWEGTLFTGKGIILFCQDCRCATFMQFYEPRHPKNIWSDSIDYPGILSSFQDHSTSGICLWSVFDIRTELPDHFKLVRHSFIPGAFELTFEAEGYRMSFYRWSPASVILFETDLAEFARKVFPFAMDMGISESWDGNEAIELTCIPPGHLRKRWHQLIGKKAVFKWVRLWHMPDANRILAVKAERNQPMDIEFLKNICSEYGII